MARCWPKIKSFRAACVDGATPSEAANSEVAGSQGANSMAGAGELLANPARVAGDSVLVKTEKSEIGVSGSHGATKLLNFNDLRSRHLPRSSSRRRL